jgi:hypothetical protein
MLPLLRFYGFHLHGKYNVARRPKRRKTQENGNCRPGAKKDIKIARAGEYQ